MGDMFSAGYIGLLLLIAPGFIAKQASSFAGNFQSGAKTEFASAISYFVYSFFSLAVFLPVLWLVLFCFGFIAADLPAAEYGALLLNLPGNILMLLIGIMIFTSFCTGAAWQMCIKKRLICLLNKINRKIGNNEIYDGENLLTDRLNDGKHHLLRVIANGRETSGLLAAISGADAEKREMALDIDDFSVWADMAKEQYPEAEKAGCKLIKVYLNLSDNIIVEEYSVPEETNTANGEMAASVE